MRVIYLDNAATTPMLPEVVEVMKESMLLNFGNPSSVHQVGRKAKVAVETARKKIAKHFNVSAREIIFTSGGTEANNLVFYNAIENLKVKRIITSKIEHHAVLNVVKSLEEKYGVEVVYVKLDAYGQVDLKDLELLLKKDSLKTLVSLMMVNNEIGNLLPMSEVSDLCKNNNALFHSDTVQAIGHYKIDLKEIPIDFVVASAHKFHGPKGVGFLYCNNKLSMKSVFYGGGQENGVRSGTENVHAVLGMDKALNLAFENIDQNELYLVSLKKYFINNLQSCFKGVSFNGLSSDIDKSSNTILNVRFPVEDDMLLFNMDLSSIAVSSGSACNSGALKSSHVLFEILSLDELSFFSVRFSFSKMNTIEELRVVLNRLKDLNCFKAF